MYNIDISFVQNRHNIQLQVLLTKSRIALIAKGKISKHQR